MGGEATNGELVHFLLRKLVEGPLSADALEAAKPAMEGARPAEVVAAVDALVAESTASGLSLEGLKPAVSRLLNLLHRPLAAGEGMRARDPLFSLLVAENKVALGLLERLRKPIAAIASSGSGQVRAAGQGGPQVDSAFRRGRDEVAGILRELGSIDTHYSRLENVLFPYFEARHPEWRCISLMWSIHDDVRASIRRLGEEDIDAAGVVEASGRLFFDVNGLVFREERLLYPVAAPLVSAAESLALYREALALGPGLLRLGELHRIEERAEGFAAALEAVGREGSGPPLPGAGPGSAPGAASEPSGRPDALPLDAGSLSLAVIDLVMKRLPLDLTFIDAEGKVAWFSNGPHRIFPRSPAVIGRDVRNCHPPESLGRVMGLIKDFRSGRRGSEAFWIRKGGRFIHIEYFAIRDAGGRFLGVLEASEDLTEKRSLEGEKRLASGGMP
jgi:DUF438 domain-containing protein